MSNEHVDFAIIFSNAFPDTVEHSKILRNALHQGAEDSKQKEVLKRIKSDSIYVGHMSGLVCYFKSLNDAELC